MLADNKETSDVQEQELDQDDQTVEQEVTQDNELLKEQAYAKKQRLRAQAAEEQVLKMQKEREEKKNSDLAEQGKYKEMFENLSEKAKVWETDSKQYQDLVNTEKTELLEKLPEEDREVFKDLGLKQLRKLVAKVSNPKPNIPNAVPGNVNDVSLSQKSYGEMTPQEKQVWHDTIMQKKS